jgi:hypothetical protein
VLTYKRLLAAGTAVVLGAGFGFASSGFAQPAPGTPGTPPGNPPLPPGTGSPPSNEVENIGNFRRDQNITVMERPREGYEARGIRAGTLLIFPKVTAVAAHDDNIYATPTNQVDDTIWRVQPQVSVTSDWIRHAMQAYAQASFNRYQNRSTENTDDYGLGVNGRLDVTHDTTITGAFGYTHGTEPRTSPNSPSAALEPVQFDQTTFEVGGRHEFNWLLATGRVNVQKFEYSSPPAGPPAPAGTIIEQSFRDHTTTTVQGRLDYAISPATAVFADVSADNRDYDHVVAGGIHRNSKGTTVLGGVDFEITNLMRGNIGLGYVKQSFDDPSQKDLSGFSANARVDWVPTQLTTVTFTGTRDIRDSAVLGAAAYISSNVSVRVDHELLRNVILSGQAGWGRDKYTGIVREDERTSAGLAASYLINRAVGVSATYDYQEQKTKKGVGNNFKDNRVGVTLTLQY